MSTFIAWWNKWVWCLLQGLAQRERGSFAFTTLPSQTKTYFRGVPIPWVLYCVSVYMPTTHKSEILEVDFIWDIFLFSCYPSSGQQDCRDKAPWRGGFKLTEISFLPVQVRGQKSKYHQGPALAVDFQCFWQSCTSWLMSARLQSCLQVTFSLCLFS